MGSGQWLTGLIESQDFISSAWLPGIWLPGCPVVPASSCTYTCWQIEASCTHLSGQPSLPQWRFPPAEHPTSPCTPAYVPPGLPSGPVGLSRSEGAPRTGRVLGKWLPWSQ